MNWLLGRCAPLMRVETRPWWRVIQDTTREVLETGWKRRTIARSLRMSEAGMRGAGRCGEGTEGGDSGRAGGRLLGCAAREWVEHPAFVDPEVLLGLGEERAG